MALHSSDRWLVAGATMLVAAATVGVRLFALRRVLSSCEGAPVRFVLRWLLGSRTDTERIAWAVTSVGRYLPSAPTCLPQAVAAWALLRVSGRPVELRIGVARSQVAPIRGHAWLESGGRTVFGGPGIGEYVPLVPARGDR